MISCEHNDQATGKFTFTGLSADIKPTDEFDGTKIRNGSVFYEINTGNVYMFDEAGQTWIKQ